MGEQDWVPLSYVSMRLIVLLVFCVGFLEAWRSRWSYGLGGFGRGRGRHFFSLRDWARKRFGRAKRSTSQHDPVHPGNSYAENDASPWVDEHYVHPWMNQDHEEDLNQHLLDNMHESADHDVLFRSQIPNKGPSMQKIRRKNINRPATTGFQARSLVPHDAKNFAVPRHDFETRPHEIERPVHEDLNMYIDFHGGEHDLDESYDEHDDNEYDHHEHNELFRSLNHAIKKHLHRTARPHNARLIAGGHSGKLLRSGWMPVDHMPQEHDHHEVEEHDHGYVHDDYAIEEREHFAPVRKLPKIVKGPVMQHYHPEHDLHDEHEVPMHDLHGYEDPEHEYEEHDDEHDGREHEHDDLELEHDQVIYNGNRHHLSGLRPAVRPIVSKRRTEGVLERRLRPTAHSVMIPKRPMKAMLGKPVRPALHHQVLAKRPAGTLGGSLKPARLPAIPSRRPTTVLRGGPRPGGRHMVSNRPVLSKIERSHRKSARPVQRLRHPIGPVQRPIHPARRLNTAAAPRFQSFNHINEVLSGNANYDLHDLDKHDLEHDFDEHDVDEDDVDEHDFQHNLNEYDFHDDYIH